MFFLIISTNRNVAIRKEKETKIKNELNIRQNISFFNPELRGGISELMFQ